MAETPDARIVSALAEATSDRDPSVRYAAIGALHVSHPDDPGAMAAEAALTRALSDPDPRVRSMAADVLGGLDPPSRGAVPALEAAARPDDPSPASDPPVQNQPGASGSMQLSIARSQREHARASAIRALGTIAPNDPEVEQVLVGLSSDPSIEVRVAVAETLSRSGFGSAAAFATEKKLASDPDIFVRAQGLTALGSYPKHVDASSPLLYQAFLSKQKPLVDGAKYALEKITKSSSFKSADARSSSQAPLRFVATYGLNPNSDQELQLLIRSLNDEDPGVRLVAAHRLGTASAAHLEAARKALDSRPEERDLDVRAQIQFSRALLAPRS
jgi:HEAT repeat protein